MKFTKLLPTLWLAGCAFAQQVPWSRPDVRISSGDRVYTADQTSNTVSVIDPSSNRLLGVIKLGDPVPGALSPLYRGQLLVHGLGYSPDSKTLAVVSVASNSVTLIETATNKVKGTIYVGRSPHEAFFTKDGAELWVTVRGENYVSVIDPIQMKETRRIAMANGPGMTMFSPDGRYAFVCSSFTPELTVVETASHEILKQVPQASPFCPDIAVTPENDEIWITLKDVGKVQVFNAKPPFEHKALFETGPITNHVNFVNNRNGKFAYVSLGGMNQVLVFRRGVKAELVATIPVGNLPHGIWPSGDGSRVYVALENDGMVAVIDTETNKVVANAASGQTSQALVYVPDAVPNGPGTDNLVPLGEAGNTARLRLSGEGTSLPGAEASVAVNSLGLLDLVQIAARGLSPKSQYEVYLAESDHAPFGKLEPLAVLKTNPDGAGIVQAAGPLKSLAAGSGSTTGAGPERFLIVTELKDPARVVLQQLISVGSRPQ
ncbi:MAG TPA: beta-propeller fold lactonase family protein [Terriglobales bacterium]|jgi:YVTN family beta-propeller protein|nr:beta-propeller fold lactonase family protein [Terriglobales bacterium]